MTFASKDYQTISSIFNHNLVYSSDKQATNRNYKKA